MTRRKTQGRTERVPPDADARPVSRHSPPQDDATVSMAVGFDVDAAKIVLGVSPARGILKLSPEDAVKLAFELCATVQKLAAEWRRRHGPQIVTAQPLPPATELPGTAEC